MNEVKKSLNRLAFYGLLLFINGIMCFIPSRFPMEKIHSLYIITLSVWMFLDYYLRVSGSAKLRKNMLRIVIMEFLFMVARAVKYSVFGNTFVLGRYTWYFYYVPLLCIPVFLFYVSLFVYAEDEQKTFKKWHWVAIVNFILILFVLTNDLHQQVFCFNPDFENWDGDYAHEWGFFVITVWQYGLYLTSVIILFAKSEIVGIRKNNWIILLPFVIGCTMMALIFAGKMVKINGGNAVEFPETLFFMVAGICECCMQLGLIPTNENYGKLMRIFSVPVQITDALGNVIYKSDIAKPLSEKDFCAPNNTRIGEHTILQRTDISGGYGFWQKDVTELDNLNGELEEAKERLAEETELTRLQNELKESQAKIEQHIIVYDTIAQRVKTRSKEISRISAEALNTKDAEIRNSKRKHIMLLGAYIKRYANLFILTSKNKKVHIGELGISIAEVLRYLNIYGIPGEFTNTATGTIKSENALILFDVFDRLIENNISVLQGVYVHLTGDADNIIFKLTLENICGDIAKDVIAELSAYNIKTSFEQEDNIGYFRFYNVGGAL